MPKKGGEIGTATPDAPGNTNGAGNAKKGKRIKKGRMKSR